MSDIAFEESSEYYENFDYFTDQKHVKVLVENKKDVRLWSDAFPEQDNLVFDFATAIDMSDELRILPAEGCKQGEFKHEVRQFEKSYDNQQAEQISLMV